MGVSSTGRSRITSRNLILTSSKFMALPYQIGHRPSSAPDQILCDGRCLDSDISPPQREEEGVLEKALDLFIVRGHIAVGLHPTLDPVAPDIDGVSPGSFQGARPPITGAGGLGGVLSHAPLPVHHRLAHRRSQRGDDLGPPREGLLSNDGDQFYRHGLSQWRQTVSLVHRRPLYIQRDRPTHHQPPPTLT